MNMNNATEREKTGLQRKPVTNRLIPHHAYSFDNETDTKFILQSVSDLILILESDGRFNIVKTAHKSRLSNHLLKQKKHSIEKSFDEKLALEFKKEVKKCLEKGNSRFTFQQNYRDATEYFDVRMTATGANKVLAVIGDVSEENRLKQELQLALTDAANALRSKSEFLANVSHEIRTPLNAILGFSQWLHENSSDIQHREYLTAILQSARSLLNLLNNILDLSKIEAGKLNIDIHPMDYQEVIDDIKQVFEQKAEEKSLKLQMTTDASVPDFIYMDELRFYQVLFNLVSNAIKFTKKGFVHISARAEKTDKDDEVNLIITIEDSGIGIKENKQKYIFDIFTQQSGQANRVYDGTGLGLAIVNGLLKKLNGSISVKSKTGKGSVFTVTFFNVKIGQGEKNRVNHTKNGAVWHLEPCTIMITDDISYNTMVLKQLINSEQVTYIEAKDGTDALAKLKTEKPDIIFMDIRMPGISGFDATELIKQDKELKNIPVIAFTASTLKEQSSRINQLFDGFLQKPVFKKDLDVLLKKFLKFTYADTPEQEVSNGKTLPEIPADCKDMLPETLKILTTDFLKKWEQIKDSLIIPEIENFKNELESMAMNISCTPVLDYCSALDRGLKSFDVELIENKIKAYPKLIEMLKRYQEEMIS
jgi:signal transduction histidine kinase/CheY-like chemotaxis protein